MPNTNILYVWPCGYSSPNYCLSFVSVLVHLPEFMKYITFTISFSFLFVKYNRSALSVANFQFILPTNLNSSKKGMNNNWLPSTIKIQSLCLCICNLSANAFPFTRVITPLILIILNIFTKHFWVHICGCLNNQNKYSG